MDHWASITTEKRQAKESNTQAAGDIVNFSPLVKSAS